MKNVTILGLSLLAGVHVMFLYWLGGGSFDRGVDLGFASIVASIVSAGVFGLFKLSYSNI